MEYLAWDCLTAYIKSLKNGHVLRWRHGYVHFTSSHNRKKDNNKFKYKKHPELPENQTVWKSDSQGVKEETFIQTDGGVKTGSRGIEDAQQVSRLGGTTFTCGKAKRNN